MTIKDEFTENPVHHRICKWCNDVILQGLVEYEKGNVVTRGLGLAQEHKLDKLLAINVARGRLAVKEAKRRTTLMKQEKHGVSMDIYDRGRRLPGSFGSNQ
jgi:hypothetical protein